MRHVWGRGEVHKRVWWGGIEGRKPLGRIRRRREDNIKMDLQDIGWESMDWIVVAQDRDRWRALVKAVMKFKVSNHAGNFMTEDLLASQEGPCCMELVSQII